MSTIRSVATTCFLCISALFLAGVQSQAQDRPKDKKAQSQRGSDSKKEKYYFLRKGDVVLFLGNSITQAAKDEVKFLKADIRKLYPELLKGPDSVVFILAGKGGEQAFEGLRRLPQLIETHKPTICVVNYGTCEITFNNPDSLAPNLKEIIVMLRKADVAVTLVSNPPSIEANHKSKNAARFVQGLPVMAQTAREVATEESVLFVDVYNPFQKFYKETDVFFTWDGIHLNQLGYRMMADELQKAWGYGKPLAPANPNSSRFLNK